MQVSQDQIQEAARIITAGGLVAFPTETVYGLGAAALNAEAVARVFEVKGRPHFDPLIVHVSDFRMLDQVVLEFPGEALALAEAFWPGPLTLVLPKAASIPGIVTAGLDTIGVRMPDHPVAQSLIETAATPIAAPSANRFGRLSPTRAEHVRRPLGASIDLILDGGPTRHGIESTVVSLVGGVTVLRHGVIPIEAIMEIAPSAVDSRDPADSPLSPGQLESHYAPSARLIVARPEAIPAAERSAVGFLGFSSRPDGFAATEVLSPEADLVVAAARLFECLHRLDQSEVATIYAEPVPEHGLGRAIMDRLHRAESGTGQPF